MINIYSVLTKFLDIAAGSKGALPPHKYIGGNEPDNELSVSPLRNAQINKVRLSGLRVSFPRDFLVIDGSSRSFSTHNFKFFITGVAAYGARNPIITYPETMFGKSIDVEWGFAGLKAPLDILKVVESDRVLSGYIRVRSLEGNYFVEYDDGVVVDEVRMGLETSFINSLLNNKFLTNDLFLVIDGPIYLAMKERKRLADMRIDVMNKLSNSGIPTVGVVKRVEGSGKLCRGSVVDFVVNNAEGFSVDVNNCNDAAFMYRLGQTMGVGVGEAVILGPLKVSAVSGKLSDYFSEDRVFWYVYTGIGPGVFRVETLESIYRKHAELIEESVQWLVGNVDDAGMPYIIDVADYYAKAVTRTLYIRFYQLSLGRGFRPTYDTLQELSRALGEEGAKP
ncbi:MAG: DNA double-strand break repair nuclease NurA [Vulcanisaeta sp.]